MTVLQTVGTTNLDFRSLYLHYECGALLYEAKAVMEVKEDFLQTLEILPTGGQKRIAKQIS